MYVPTSTYLDTYERIILLLDLDHEFHHLFIKVETSLESTHHSKTKCFQDWQHKLPSVISAVHLRQNVITVLQFVEDLRRVHPSFPYSHTS